MHDIIPDIHGQADKLRQRLSALGYQERSRVWRHPDPDRICVFLGDFIDRGPKNGEVIDIVRRMLDAGTARAIMGNHELNAIHYHTTDPRTGDGVRPRSTKNSHQHQSFLNEFPLGGAGTRDLIAWMKSLPLFLEFDTFRVVHACWDEARISELRAHTPNGILNDDQFIAAADPTTQLFDLVETATKGPEYPLPGGWGFHDKDGTWRDQVRIRWWAQNATSWAEIAASVPDLSDLPTAPPPKDILERSYPQGAKPVFFGHYWLTGDPELQAPNALCLDYSAGKTGPLVSYQMDPAQETLSLQHLSGHENAQPPKQDQKERQ
ncbi:metallophosphoesterase [Sedimentimonas flavescens]|uniref:metallophosphoesterase n=1 Tax=Sedimentimonas flavescens TaxID=2851012 RepID=UPI001C4A5AD1|nr:metallophosphoesterase [Sedimentimonas flavescens]MBW0158396.1 metallophosphoesterase [Sedimentimonas flavescens]